MVHLGKAHFLIIFAKCIIVQRKRDIAKRVLSCVFPCILRLVTIQYTASSWLPSTCKHEYMRLTWNLLSTSAKDHLHYSDITQGRGQGPFNNAGGPILARALSRDPIILLSPCIGDQQLRLCICLCIWASWRLTRSNREKNFAPSINHATLALHDLVMYGQA
jgi:hypothetical protein